MNGFLDHIKDNFLATGVGSLPHEKASSAVDFVFNRLSYHIPFWPQLPKRSFYENMYVQFSEKLPGVKVDEEGKKVSVNTQDAAYVGELEECFIKCEMEVLDYFQISPSYAEAFYLMGRRLKALRWKGWVKFQVIGPFSLGLSVLDEEKHPILYNREIAELLTRFLSLKAAWLIEYVRSQAPEAKVIVFIDEPYLVAVGTNQFALSKEKIVGDLNVMAERIHKHGALAGMHCCGNTDWELALSSDIDILNFDAYGYLDKLLIYEKQLSIFLERGGLPAVGIVPSSRDVLKDGIEDQLFEVLRKNPRLLANGALITPSCGLSGLSLEVADKVQALCVKLAERLRGGF